VDLSRSQQIHVVAVGGAGMSAIATVLATMGHRVSGSDLGESNVLDRLRSLGIEVYVGHRAEQVGSADVVVVSTAVGEDNPEVREAHRRGLPVLSRAEALASITALRRCVAISGTHGKTTTTSMLASILVAAGWKPSFLIGGEVHGLSTNAKWDEGEWVVVEADESDGTFLALDPEVAVVTNVEADHLDHYGDLETLVEAFDRFCTGRPGGVVAGADDLLSAEIGACHQADLVGTSPSAVYRIEDIAAERAGVSFDLRGHGTLLGRIQVPVSGANIATNAAVAAAAAVRMGVPFASIAEGLGGFDGVARRFEPRGESGGVRYVDDYAHLPTEVRAVLEAARGTGSDRVVVVFQPHRYTRTAALADQFADSFTHADVVLITDVYPAGEKPIEGVTGRLVADAVSRSNPDLPVTYVESRSDLLDVLTRILRPGDLCLTLGAGDLTSLPDEMLAGTAR
jgi:UDP-N-acetylmuramate--alanine ligase